MVKKIIGMVIFIVLIPCLSNAACGLGETRIFPVTGAFVYDFKGYFTDVWKEDGTKYPIDNRAFDDCKPYSPSCIKKGELWFCVCRSDTVQGNDEVMIGIQDKTK